MSEADIDARLGTLLRGAERRPDPLFVSAVEALVRLDAAAETARLAAWRRFAGEAAAALVVALAALLIVRFDAAAAAAPTATIGAASSLLLWLALRDDGDRAPHYA